MTAGTPALAAMGLDQDPCCEGVGPGQTCPMHQSRDGDRTCKMRSACPRADFALVTLLGSLGILPDPTDLVTAFDRGGAISSSTGFAPLRTDRPDAPPPRS